MAYDDALFQLGMDLTRSSTAQKEDLFETAPRKHGQMNSNSSGREIILDLIAARNLTSVNTVEEALRAALDALNIGDSAVSSWHALPHGTYRASAAVGTGSVNVEAWPLKGFVAVNMTEVSLSPEVAMTALADAFGAREVILRRTPCASLAVRFAKKAAAPVENTRHRTPAKHERAARAA